MGLSRVGVSLRGKPGAAAKESADRLEPLLGRAGLGDEEAFGQVCQQVAAVVFGVARSVVRDQSLAEEVSQDVLLEIWRSAPRFQAGRGSAMAWVTTIAHRRAVDRVRAERRAVERQLRGAEHSIPYDEVAEEVEARLDRHRVRCCLRSLTALQRETVTLAYYGGMTVREVAARLGIAEGTAKTRMRDGLIRLRSCLGAD